MGLIRRILSVEFFAIQNFLAIVVGGLLAAVLMKPWLDAGPIRLTTYIVFSLASFMLARKYLSIVRKSEDGRASIYLVASVWWWASFGITALVIEYLIVARVYGFWPHLSENLQERISYFFISGAAVGVFFKAITFEFIPTEWLIGRRVSAWPLTLWRRGDRE